MKSKTLSYGKVDLSFVRNTDGQFLIPAFLIGLVLGYPKGGKQFVQKVISKCSKKLWHEYNHLRLPYHPSWEATAEIEKELTSEELNTFVSPEGIMEVLGLTETKNGKEFLTWMATSCLPYLYGDTPTKEEFSIDDRLSYCSTLTEFLSARLLPEKETEEAARELFNFMKTGSFNIKNSLKNGEDGTVVPSNQVVELPEGKSALKGSASVVPEMVKFGERPFGLDDEYLSNAEISEKFQIPKKFVSKYLSTLRDEEREENDRELWPNALAKEFVAVNGMEAVPRFKNRNAVFENHDKSGLAFYAEDNSGQIHWRNYWSKKVVEGVRNSWADECSKPNSTWVLKEASKSGPTPQA